MESSKSKMKLYGSTMDKCLAKTLPLLPGNNFNFNHGSERFHLSAHWDLQEGRPVLADRDAPKHKPGVGGIEQPVWATSKIQEECSMTSKGQGTRLSPFVALDKQVLTFEGYYEESIPESGAETYRVHHCKIFYYLEDDTVQVIEPKTYNSGQSQGTLIRRHKIPLNVDSLHLTEITHDFHNLFHFNVGCEVRLYGKVFFICSCDAFTRNFLNRIGVAVPNNMEMPPDVATEKQKDLKQSLFAKKPHKCHDTRGPFLAHDRHVLRFWAYWDDRCSLYGDLREFVIHYFLSDNTMEIRETIRPNSGYDSFPCFLRRSRVLKDPSKLVPLPGVETPQTILNVFGSMHGTKSKKAHYVADPLGLGERQVDYYSDKDLNIGAVINALGRAFILVRADEFTQSYYRERYGVQDFTPLELTKEEQKKPLPRPETPPYTGWGTEEDSLVSCKSLEMRPHVADYRKFAEKEKDILRFEAKIYSPLQSVNRDRRFTINYYMADDTVQVFENEHPNTGLPKGNFLARGRVKKPGYQPEIGKKPEFYEPKDFFVGSVININSFDFQLLSADEFTYSYMEKNKNEFPSADVCLILSKVREAFGPLQAEDVLKCFSQNDTCLQGVMDLANFRSLLLQISKCGLSEHEILTLSRCYAANSPPPGVDFDTLQAIVQTELRKFQFDRYLLERVEYTFRHRDPCRTGLIDRETCRATLKGAKLPLDKALLDFLVDNFPAGDDCNRVDYCQLLKFLNWEQSPACCAKPAAIKCIMEWVLPQPPLKILCVNYRAFLDDVCPNIKCALPSVVCCCAESRPCPSHPNKCTAQFEPSTDSFCQNDDKNIENGAPECGNEPSEPINIYIKPCFIKATEGKSHKCAPGAQKCWAFEGNEDKNENVSCMPIVDMGEKCI